MGDRGDVADHLDNQATLRQRADRRLATGSRSLDTHFDRLRAFMSFGDTIRIEMLDAAGHSVFGAIEQQIVPYGR